jgi:hypothetical protein
MNFDDGGLVTIVGGVHAGAAECLGPVRGKPLDMIGVKSVTERMAHYLIGHHSTMPSGGKTSQTFVATCGFENSWHASMMTSRMSMRKTERRECD